MAKVDCNLHSKAPRSMELCTVPGALPPPMYCKGGMIGHFFLVFCRIQSVGVGVKKFGLELFKRVTNGDCRGEGNLVSGCLGVQRSLYDPWGHSCERAPLHLVCGLICRLLCQNHKTHTQQIGLEVASWRILEPWGKPPTHKSVCDPPHTHWFGCKPSTCPKHSVLTTYVTIHQILPLQVTFCVCLGGSLPCWGGKHGGLDRSVCSCGP
jgi:hypothetical protein